MGKVREILEELHIVLAGRSGMLDSLLPPLFFVILDALWGMEMAIAASLGLALVIPVIRLFRLQSLLYAHGGVAAVALAALIAQLLGGPRVSSYPALSPVRGPFFSVW